MADHLTVQATVAHGDVDRQQCLLLGRLFKLLQDAAIAHANQFGAGANAVDLRGETWVLHRIEADIARYPRVGEAVTIATWSTGIKGFKGFRDFRVHDRARQPLLTASSVWLYLNVATRSVMRVPRTIAAAFPVGPEPAAFPALERAEIQAPPAVTKQVAVTLRYSDFDVNEHVNNAAYFDLVQAALARTGGPVHPRHVRLRFARAIPLDAEIADVGLEHCGRRTRFVIRSSGTECACGDTDA